MQLLPLQNFDFALLEIKTAREQSSDVLPALRVAGAS